MDLRIRGTPRLPNLEAAPCSQASLAPVAAIQGCLWGASGLLACIQGAQEWPTAAGCPQGAVKGHRCPRSTAPDEAACLQLSSNPGVALESGVWLPSICPAPSWAMDSLHQGSRQSGLLLLEVQAFSSRPGLLTSSPWAEICSGLTSSDKPAAPWASIPPGAFPSHSQPLHGWDEGASPPGTIPGIHALRRSPPHCHKTRLISTARLRQDSPVLKGVSGARGFLLFGIWIFPCCGGFAQSVALAFQRLERGVRRASGSNPTSAAKVLLGFALGAVCSAQHPQLTKGVKKETDQPLEPFRAQS